MCPSDLPALFSFPLPHTCIWIHPEILQLVSDRLACRHVVYDNVPLPRCVLMAGWLCWHVPL
jgi:hypothetical protein